MISGTDVLRRNELFATIPERQLSKLKPICSEFAAVEDSMVFTEGMRVSHLYLLTDGRIALQKAMRVPHGTGSRRTTIAVCQPGEVVGWSALVEPYKYTLSAVAWDSAHMVRMDSNMLRRALDMYPELGYAVMRTLAEVMSKRLRQTMEALTNERQTLVAVLRT